MTIKHEDVFHYLTVKEYISKSKVRCECKCGKEKWTTELNLVQNKVKSCGCYNQECRLARKGKNNPNFKGGLIEHPLYDSWKSMKTRCYNSNYLGYLGGSITIQDDWINDFSNFYNWAIKNGWKQDLVLSRKNGSKNFTFDNCIFITREEASKDNFNYEKAKETNLRKYGVEYYTQTKEYLIRKKKTCLEKYGVEHPQQLDNIKEKIRQTSLERYGAEHYCKTQAGKDKIQATCQERYGYDWATLVPEIRAKQMETFKKNGVSYTFNGKTTSEIIKELDISRSGFLSRVKKFGFDVAVSMEKGQTAIESIMENFLIENNIQYEKQVKFDNRFADFVLTDYKIIIECDGLYWHSDAVNDNNSYHKQKQELYLKYGFTSLFFREDEIETKFEIVKSIILNKLNMSNRIYGRKTEIVEVKKTNFFIDNHLMGKGQGKILALKYNDTIVCAIQYINKKNHIEISRLCNQLKTAVVGGISKLFKYLENLYPNKTIISFVDKRYGTGEFLEKLGFVKETERISFVWTKDTKTYHRMKYPKNTGYDNKCNKLWDCGQAKYIKYYM